MKTLFGSAALFGACALSAGFSLAAPNRAAACYFLPAEVCNPAVRVFRDDARVPGNLVYFKVFEEHLGELVLRKADGSVVPATIRTIGDDRVFAPDEPIQGEQELELEYGVQCPDPLFGTVFHSEKYRFSTSAPRSVEMHPPHMDVQLSFDGTRQVRVAEISYFAAGEGAWDHLTEVTFAAPDAQQGEILPRMKPLQGQVSFSLQAACNGGALVDSCGPTPWNREGTHRVVATASVVGAEQQPEPVELEVELSCPQSASGGEDDETTRAPDDNGCSVAAHEPTHTLSLVTLLSAALVFARRRRRDQRA